MANFGFNNYGRGGDPYYIKSEGEVDKLTAQKLGLPVIQASLISEGSAVENNGRGTIMLTKSVAFNRNPANSRSRMNIKGFLVYKRSYGLKKD